MASISQELREAVLQAAIQGKLTEQLPEDGDARDLLAQIKAEKERMIKEKKIKKEKPLEPISEDEVPFDIPENWKWCYLGDLFNHNAGKALNARNTKGEKHKYITTSNVYWDHFELDNLREMYYTPDEVEKYSVRKGDLLVLEGGDIGRTAIWDRDESYCVQNHVHRLRPYLKVDVKYFYYCMMYYKNNGMIYGKGIAIQGLSANALHCINIPLPPLAEQHRIVARVEELMAKIDELEKVENKLKALHQEFPGDMKAALLQAAMQGKLTEQLPEDGNAESLVCEINKLREDGIRKKTIRKSKGDASFTIDDLPYGVPENWRWMRFGQIVSNHDGERRPVAKDKRINEKGTYPYYGATGAIDVVDDYLFDGDYLMIGEDGGNFFVDRDNSFIAHGKFWANNHVHVVQPIVVNIVYLKRFLDSCNLPAMGLINGIAVPKLNQKNMNSIMVPLPPLAEQRRIVERLDKLLPLCDSLQAEL